MRDPRASFVLAAFAACLASAAFGFAAGAGGGGGTTNMADSDPDDHVVKAKLYEHAFHPKNETGVQSSVPRKGVVHESEKNVTSHSSSTPPPPPSSGTPCKWPEKCSSTAVPPRDNALSSVPSSVKSTSASSSSSSPSLGRPLQPQRHHKPVAAVDDPNWKAGEQAANGGGGGGDPTASAKFPSRALPYVVGVLCSLAIVALVVVGVYKCVVTRLPRGQYRKVDFLIDGMYDT